MKLRHEMEPTAYGQLHEIFILRKQRSELLPAGIVDAIREWSGGSEIAAVNYGYQYGIIQGKRSERARRKRGFEKNNGKTWQAAGIASLLSLAERKERGSMVKDLLKTLKALAGKRREISLIEVRKYDSDYEEAMDKAVELRNRYETMELRPEDKGTIDSLLDTLDEVEVTQVNLAYVAGLADCLLILERLDLFQL